jgi:hypothetical protein
VVILQLLLLRAVVQLKFYSRRGYCPTMTTSIISSSAGSHHRQDNDCPSILIHPAQQLPRAARAVQPTAEYIQPCQGSFISSGCRPKANGSRVQHQTTIPEAPLSVYPAQELLETRASRCLLAHFSFSRKMPLISLPACSNYSALCDLVHLAGHTLSLRPGDFISSCPKFPW